MAWMMDTYSMQKGYAVPEIVTGKPISLGGSLFRHEATGAGVVMVIARACARLGWKLAEQRCVVQGFGNVGGIAAQELVDRGATVIAVSDVSGGIARRGRTRHPDAERLREGARLARRLGAREAHHERGAARAAVRRARARGPRGSGARRQRAAPALPHGRRGRRTARPRSRPTRSSPSAASRSCRTSSRTPAASPSRTSSGCRTWVGSSGTATRSGPSCRRSSTTPSTASGTSPRSSGIQPAHGGAGRRHPRGRRRARGPRALSVSERVRDAMVAAPRTLDASAPARRRRARRWPAPRCAPCSSAQGRRLVGVVTRKTLVRAVVAAGLDPAATPLGDIAEEPYLTLDADMPLEEAFHLLEERDLERVPVSRPGASSSASSPAASSSAGSPRTSRCRRTRASARRRQARGQQQV